MINVENVNKAPYPVVHCHCLTFVKNPPIYCHHILRLGINVK